MEGIEPEIMQTAAALTDAPRTRWMTVLSEFADKVAAKAREGGGASCQSCGAAMQTCAACTARAVVTRTLPGAIRDKARETVRTMGPVALMAGMQWIERTFGGEERQQPPPERPEQQPGQDQPPPP